jgi:hypothetical protein
MLSFDPNPVQSSGITHGLSTGQALGLKLSPFHACQSARLQTVFEGHQVVEITVENSLVPRKQLGLSTTTIEI